MQAHLKHIACTHMEGLGRYTPRRVFLGLGFELQPVE